MSDKAKLEQEQTLGAVNAEAVKCSGCGANMRFDAQSKSLKCDYCGSEVKLEYSEDFSERDFSELSEAERWSDGVREATCQNCGAREVYRSNEVAAVCPFCASPMIISKEDYKGLKPNVLIPFAIGREQAASLCKKWLKSRIFSPRRFKKNLRKVDNINGVYCPVWTFDSQTVTSYSGVLGKYVVKTYTVNGKTQTRTETEYFHVSGQIFMIFDDIKISGGDVLDAKAQKTFDTFTQKDYVKYDNLFLAGYSAVGYTVQPEEAWKKAEEVMKENIKKAIMKKHHADVVRSLDMDVFHEGRSFKYMLAPYYVGTCKYKDKLFKQFISGVTGKITGKAPVSPVRVLIALLPGLGVLAFLVYLMMTAHDNGCFSQLLALSPL